MVWTPERVTELKKRLAAGEIPGRIAEAMGITRNAVIGKADRLGLLRPTPYAPAKKAVTTVRSGSPARHDIQVKRIKRRRAAAAGNKVEAVSVEEVAQPETQPEAVVVPFQPGVSLADLERRHCRWPIDGADGSLRFCGRNRCDGSSYCAAHTRTATRLR